MVREEYSECKACGDRYLVMPSDKGYCKECSAEIFRGDISLSIGNILESNNEKVERENRIFRSRPKGQRVGIGKTTS